MPTKKAATKKAPARKTRPSARGLSSSAQTASTVELVNGVLQGYLERGVFRSFNAVPAAGGKASFKMLWHHDKRFELLLNVPKKTLEFPLLLPGVPEDSPMYAAFREFIGSLHSAELVPHRRIDPAKARLTCANDDGAVSLTIRVKDGDFEYATRKLIHTVHETFLGFLADGPYYEYLVEQFDLDPDRY